MAPTTCVYRFTALTAEHLAVQRTSNAPPSRLMAPYAAPAAGRVVAQPYRPGVG